MTTANPGLIWTLSRRQVDGIIEQTSLWPGCALPVGGGVQRRVRHIHLPQFAAELVSHWLLLILRVLLLLICVVVSQLIGFHILACIWHVVVAVCVHEGCRCFYTDFASKQVGLVI